MPYTCASKAALLKGLRPVFANQQQVAATQKVLSSACITDCIYCDIWKLAALIATHMPLAARYNLRSNSPTSSPTSSTPSSPTFSPISRTTSESTPYPHILAGSKRIEAQMQTQRSQLSSILSFCTVSGVEESVEDLLDQEEDLEEELLEELQDQYDYDYGYASQYAYSDTKTYDYPQQRRPSLVDVAI
ncbi:hypothetical protein LTR10_020474 [Elasticomyces elasticus]|uniref:Uncharacterized protein n=1 Tax=Exophiala sideris TaxID=1016849 RepID=A0ABR0J1X5_9EURO|nr:hypothetical protein LTR10_020474 [Elasticomyces elasticus]KAK5024725.1 hypothetical protein LTS07_008571 [Exophiala sideris]KAK5030818.1 hypothetical protein LTR13_008172 [Exophiala sideris]KAK5054360.1 hypothetical protein LTR69_008975 [Exophiala sideris]KAK5179760.1 hypothetical protein LTR44_007928 [Eurotiomycetes sp. CCFEE 6388]